MRAAKSRLPKKQAGRIAVERHDRVGGIGHVDLRHAREQVGAPHHRCQEDRGKRRARPTKALESTVGRPCGVGIEPVDDRQVEVGVPGPEVVDHQAGRIDEDEPVAQASHADRTALDDLDVERRWQHATHPRVGDPGRRLEARARGVEIHLQQARPPQRREDVDHFFLRQVPVASHRELADVELVPTATPTIRPRRHRRRSGTARSPGARVVSIPRGRDDDGRSRAARGGSGDHRG